MKKLKLACLTLITNIVCSVCVAQLQNHALAFENEDAETYTVFADLNSNGNFDINEKVLPKHLLISEGVFYVTDNTGQFKTSGNILGSIKSANKYFKVNPINAQSKQKVNLIGLIYNQTQNDYSINLVADKRKQNATETQLHLIAKQALPTDDLVQLKLLIPAGLKFKNSSIVPAEIHAQHILWNINNAQQLNETSVDVTLIAIDNCLPDAIRFNAEIITAATDLLKSNNHVTLDAMAEPTITPNSKIVDPAGIIKTNNTLPTNISLLYTIHFQNTSNTTASNLTIVDTLPNKLAPGTFSFVASSHPCNIQLSQNAVTFSFTNINIPDSGASQLQSMGWVQFMVNTNNNVLLNDSIENVADVIFDVNQPIRTTEARIEFVNIAAIDDMDSNALLQIWPNPIYNTSKLILSKACQNCVFTIFDATGKQIQNRELNYELNLNADEFDSGLYFYKVSNTETLLTQGKFVVTK